MRGIVWWIQVIYTKQLRDKKVKRALPVILRNTLDEHDNNNVDAKSCVTLLELQHNSPGEGVNHT